MWGEAIADIFCREGAVRFMAVVFLVAAPVFAVFGVYSLIRTLLG